jgi:hypothetical protein
MERGWLRIPGRSRQTLPNPDTSQTAQFRLEAVGRIEDDDVGVILEIWPIEVFSFRI